MGKYKSTDPNHRFVNREIPDSVAERAQISHTVDEAGCWITFGKPGANGYGQISWSENGKTYGVPVHRASYTWTYGRIADGMVIDHTCHNRACVNPDHLRELPRDENARRQGAGDFPLGQCRFGHPLTESRKRLKGVSEGLTYCGACLKERNDQLSLMRTQLRLLEIAYGMGDWHEKRTYRAARMERQARCDAIRATWMEEAA